MMAVQEKRYTREDLMRLSDAGKRYELIQGELREMAPIGHIHGALVINIGYHLQNSVLKNGKLSISVGFNLKDDTTLAPDIAFVESSRFDKSKWDDYFDGAPDLAVEVIAPTETATYIHEKMILYLEHGTKMILVVYPKFRTIEVRTQTGVVTLNQHDVIDGGDVLPGLKVPVQDIFSVLD